MTSNERIEGLARAICSEDSSIRLEAARALGQIRDQEALPLLASALENENELVRHYAMVALVNIGEPAIPQLASALKSEHPILRFYAAQALGDLKAEGAAPALIALLSDRDNLVGERALDSIIEIGATPQHPSIPDLISALATDGDKIKDYASSALALMGNPAIPQLVETLRSTVFGTSAAMVLARIGAPATPSLIAELGRAQNAPLGKERNLPISNAALALERINDSSAIPSLAALLLSEAWWDRFHAQKALNEMLPGNTGHLRALCEGLRYAKALENGGKLDDDNNELSRLRATYSKWVAHLSKKYREERRMEGLPVPPRFRRPPAIGRKSQHAMCMRIGGGRA